MKEQVENRLEELRQQFESGSQQLAGLESRAEDLRQTLLRISGAIQVLEEMLEEKPAEGAKIKSADAAAKIKPADAAA